MKTISFYSRSAGSGKTTTSFKFHIYLSKKGYRVKGLDCDSISSGSYSKLNTNTYNVSICSVEYWRNELDNSNYDFVIIDFPPLAERVNPQLKYVNFVFEPTNNKFDIEKNFNEVLRLIVEEKNGRYLI